VVRHDFGFRKRPYRSRVTARVGYATEAARFRAELQGDFYRVNSRVHTSLLLRYSGIDVISFFGFGNESPRIDDDEFYRVPQRQYEVTPSVVLPLGTSGSLTVGPTLKYANTELEQDRFITAAQPYGVGKFGQIGAKATAEWDTRDQPAAARRGVRLMAGGSVYPAVWDVDSTYGEIHGEASTYLTPNTSFGPTLAVRAGAKKVWGAYPFFEAAFVGGSDNVRGLRTQRYAGDASVFGSAELRARLGRYYIILPGTFGVFALGDVGRVYLEGESSDTWHTGYGGGFWFAPLTPGNTLSFAIVRGDERTALYVQAGFAY
jgi:outer membrane protein assembly factor BamA